MLQILSTNIKLTEIGQRILSLNKKASTKIAKAFIILLKFLSFMHLPLKLGLLKLPLLLIKWPNKPVSPIRQLVF